MIDVGDANRCSDVAGLLALTADEDPAVGAHALRSLCPCHLRRDIPAVWDRLLILVHDIDAASPVALHTWLMARRTSGGTKWRMPSAVLAHDADVSASAAPGCACWRPIAGPDASTSSDHLSVSTT